MSFSVEGKTTTNGIFFGKAYMEVCYCLKQTFRLAVVVGPLSLYVVMTLAV